MFLALRANAQWDRQFRRYHILARVWRADWPRFFDLVRLGIPIGLTIVAESGLFSAAALIMGLIGTAALAAHAVALQRSEEHTSELQSLMRISYAVFCLKKKITKKY